MNTKTKSAIALLVILGIGSGAFARIKLVALPERAATVIRLDNPRATLIEEERVLTLQEGLNKVDFSWKGVSMKYEKKDANMLEFEIQLPARSEAGPAVKELKMTYHH